MGKSIEIEGGLVDTGNQEEGVMVINCVIGRGVYSGVIKRFQNQTDAVVA